MLISLSIAIALHLPGDPLAECHKCLSRILLSPLNAAGLTAPHELQTLTLDAPLETTFQSTFGKSRSLHFFNAATTSRILEFFNLEPYQFSIGRGLFELDSVTQRKADLIRLHREWLLGGPKIHGIAIDRQGKSTIIVEHKPASTGASAIENAITQDRYIILAYDEVAEYAWRQFNWILPRSTPDHWLLEERSTEKRYIPKAPFIMIPTHTNPIHPPEATNPDQAILDALRRRKELWEMTMLVGERWPEFYHEIAAAGLSLASDRTQYLEALQEISPQLSERLTEKK